MRAATTSNLLYYNSSSGEITEWGSTVGKVVAAGVVASTGTADKEFGANTSKSSTGEYLIEFTSGFSTVNDYAVNMMAIEDSATSPSRNFKVYVKQNSRNTGNVTVLTADDDNGGSDDVPTDHPFYYSIISLV